MSAAPQPNKPIKYSPTRLLDFKKCHLLYKLKYIDGIKFPAGIDAFRGSVVHDILEKLFKVPQIERTVDNAYKMIDSSLDKELSNEFYSASDEISSLRTDLNKRNQMISEVKELVANYFALENPAKLQAEATEKWFDTKLVDGPTIGGFLDRLEYKQSAGARIVDYKTGKKPDKTEFEDGYIFQLLFYSLLYMKTHRGDLPKQIKILYLKNSAQTVFEPTDEQIVKVETEIRDLVKQIESETLWATNKNNLCDWCSYKELCPEFGPEFGDSNSKQQPSAQ